MLTLNMNKPDHAFTPGETVEGTIQWHDIAADAASIELRLFWHTEGKGTLDMEIVSSIEIANPTASGESRFQFSVPNRPHSFSGKLISLIWSIESIVFPSQETERVDLTISNTGKEILLSRQTQTTIETALE